MGFFKNIIKSLLKVSRPIFVFDENELRFKINSDFYYTYNLNNFDVKTRHDPYILEAYTIKNPDIFLEYIQIDNDSMWNGEALSFYEDFLKQQCKFDSFKQVENRSFDHYEFKIFEIDEEYILHLIYIWEVNKDVFILDNNTHLYKSLLSSLDKNYKYKFDDRRLINFDFNSSLVKQNAFNSYVGTDND